MGLGRAGGEAAEGELGKEMKWQWRKQAGIGKTEAELEGIQQARTGALRV